MRKGQTRQKAESATNAPLEDVTFKLDLVACIKPPCFSQCHSAEVSWQALKICERGSIGDLSRQVGSTELLTAREELPSARTTPRRALSFTNSHAETFKTQSSLVEISTCSPEPHGGRTPSTPERSCRGGMAHMERIGLGKKTSTSQRILEWRASVGDLLQLSHNVLRNSKSDENPPLQSSIDSFCR